MAFVARFLGPLRRPLLLLSCILAICTFVTAQDALSSCSSCVVSLPTLSRYTWSAISYESSITIETTVATLVYIIDPRGETSTSTKFAPTTETLNITVPTTVNKNTLTKYYANGRSTETYVVTYPTSFVDYAPVYQVRAGQVPTSSVCQTYSASFIDPASHPFYPQPSTANPPVATDTLGYDYSLVYDYLPPSEATSLDQPAFTSWYLSVYSDQAAVTDCVANNSYTALGTTTSAVPTTSAAPTISTVPTTISSTSSVCRVSNSTTACSNITVTQTNRVSVGVPPTEETSTPGFYSSPSYYSVATSESESALTHTSVRFLTATSTTHISSDLNISPVPDKTTKDSRPPGYSPTSPGSEAKPTTKEGEKPNNSPTHSSQGDSGDEPGESPTHSPQGGSGNGPQSQRNPSHTVTYTVAPNTRATTIMTSQVTTASSGQLITRSTTVLSTMMSNGQQITSRVVSSYETKASGGETITVPTSIVSNVVDAAGTHTLQIPKTNIITATSGQVVNLLTTSLSTFVSDGKTFTTAVVGTIKSTATTSGLITQISNDLTTVTGAVGTRVLELPGSTIITASSGQRITESNGKVLTATSNGEVFTVPTQSETTITAPAGTYTTGLPGAASTSTGGSSSGSLSGSPQSQGRAGTLAPCTSLSLVLAFLAVVLGISAVL